MNIACLILNYNDAPTVVHLVNQLRSVKALSHILVVDNCSTDDSYSVLKALEQDHIEVIRSDRNGGYGYGNNYGVRYIAEHFHSEFIIIANPDVEFSEKLILRFYETMVSHEDTACLSAIAFKPDGTRQRDTGWKVPNAWTYTLSSSLILNKVLHFEPYPKDYFEGEGLAEVECVPGSLLMVRTKDMLQYGMYDERVFLYCEETILGQKFKIAGKKTYIVKDEVFIHHHSVSINKSIHGALRQRKILFQSKYIFIENYLHVNPLGLFFIRQFLKLSLMENFVYYRLKGL